MTTPSLNILPSDSPAPETADRPLEGARRWISPYEEPGFLPLVQVFVSQAAYDQLVEHTGSDLENEVGGVLVGSLLEQRGTGQPFIVVETSLPARFTRQGSADPTFTQDSLVQINTEMFDRFPDRQIVGWYHTHPRMGIFLSDYDTWLHQHFFPETWQVALVVEPHSSTGGFFIRRSGGALDPGRYFGFYEMGGTSGKHIVPWSNLRSDGPIELEGESQNE